ncbi:TBC1 domain family member 14 [Plakobranchus ocellatus]|uniref:TBC1 domain family member 14 n=1 Tax=Plakobranchus ocellatus TaxID=259542 RepID=A0AAV3YLU9_9GAST|nr:TBC1 domain family member 14 [Plakobranchus ocellatus]
MECERSVHPAVTDNHNIICVAVSHNRFEDKHRIEFRTVESLFSKRAKEESPPGWKLFGRVPPKPASARNPHEISSEYQSRQFKVEKPVFPPAGKKQGSEVMSTIALILENGPTNLPSKNPEEAEKHRQQYEEMVEAAKKKGTPDAEEAPNKESSVKVIKLDVSRTFPHLCIFQKMTAYYRTFEEFFKENLPKLYAHFSSLSVTLNLYIMEWVLLMYSKSLSLDVACKVWDLFFRDGEEFLFRSAITILKLYEAVLLKMDFSDQFLTKLPENISGDQLFKELESVRMSIDKRGFQAVHAFFKDLHAGTS